MNRKFKRSAYFTVAYENNI